VKLTGLIEPGCSAMTGKVKARKRPPAILAAHRSGCGDGSVDIAIVEDCEPPR
jgi:hypothetical protein